MYPPTKVIQGGGTQEGLGNSPVVYFGHNPCNHIWFCFTENYAFCIELSPLQVAIMGLELCQRNLPKSISTEHPAPPFCTADPTRTKYRNSSHNHNLFFAASVLHFYFLKKRARQANSLAELNVTSKIIVELGSPGHSGHKRQKGELTTSSSRGTMSLSTSIGTSSSSSSWPPGFPEHNEPE